jgi:transposase-like protein
MIHCPLCLTVLTLVIRDVLRKTDESRFDCPGCNSPLLAKATRTVTIQRDPTDG